MTNNYLIQIENVDDVKKIGAAGDSKSENEAKRRGRPRKQAENGPADGSQVKGKNPLTAVTFDRDENGKIIFDSFASFFLRTHTPPPFIFKGSEVFEWNETTGWTPSNNNSFKKFISEFLLYNYREVHSDSYIKRLETRVETAWTVKPPSISFGLPGRYSFWIQEDLERRKEVDGDENGELSQIEKILYYYPKFNAIPAPFWIPCQNVLLNVRTGETRDFSRDLFTVGRVPCDYDPEAVCPRWKSFLEETLDPESAAVLQEFFGVSLTFDRSFQGFAILYGEGGNGKGVVCEILKTLNNGAVCAVSLARLGERFSRYALSDYRVNIHPDTNGRINNNKIPEVEETVKLSTMGESDDVEKKGVDPETRPLVALNVWAMNPPYPAWLDNSKGIDRRQRVIHFQKTFAGTQGENNHLTDELKAELPGILNWAMAGYRRLIDSGAKQFSNSEAGRRIVLESRKLNHPEETFFDVFLTVTENGLVSSRKVYDRYRKWTEETGNKFPMAENKFSARLLAYFQKTGAQVQKERRRNLHYYTGLELEGDLEGF